VTAQDFVETRKTYDLLQRQLARRDSILHFAHAAISMLLALIAAASAGKLLWDFDLDESIGLLGSQIPVGVFLVPALVLAFLMLAYSTVRYVMGHQTLSREVKQFAALKSLRAVLRLDDPSALLPQ
jgi:hypothetical protein